MMNNFLSKLSLYDFLTTILLGGCLYVPIVYDVWIDLPLLMRNEMVMLGLCYLIGLIAHKFSESFDFSHYLNSRNKDRSRFCMSLLSPICRNQGTLIAHSRKLVGDILDSDSVSVTNENVVSVYLRIYYRVMTSGRLGNIPKIEAHSALIRDLSFVVLPVACILGCKWNLHCSGWIILLLFSFTLLAMLIIIRYNSELKIHSLIWEQEKYIDSYGEYDVTLNKECTPPEKMDLISI